MKISMVLRQPPPSFFAPYPAISALSQLGIILNLNNTLKILCHYYIAYYFSEEPGNGIIAVKKGVKSGMCQYRLRSLLLLYPPPPPPPPR